MTKLPHFQLYIDGTFTEGHDGQTMTTQNPATGADWATFACAAPRDVDRAIAAARRVLDDPEWRDMTQTQRGKLLYRLGELIAENAEKLGRIETTDSGKLLAETASQTGYVGEYYRYYAGLADKIEGAVFSVACDDRYHPRWEACLVYQTREFQHRRGRDFGSFQDNGTACGQRRAKFGCR